MLLIKKIQRAAKWTLFLGHLGLILTICGLFFELFHIQDWMIFLGMFCLTELGLTVGFHRYFTHKGFKTYSFVEYLLGIFGCMAAQGPVSFWVAHHRAHHHYSDQAQDPHSPLCPETKNCAWRQFWHSHFLWLVRRTPLTRKRYLTDLRHNKVVRRLDLYYVTWVLLGLLIPMVISLMIDFSLRSAVAGLILPGLARIAIVHHCTWAVNSIGHLFGTKAYDSGDNSRNNAVVALLTMGEGWHNNHHAFPRSVRHGLTWWQWDPSYWLILGLYYSGLAWDLHVANTQGERLYGILPDLSSR